MAAVVRNALGRSLMVVAVAAVLSGCNLFTRLSEVGSEPKLSEITNPTALPGYRPVSLPMPSPQALEDNPNSLWRPGARAFFKDIRAKEVGDILTVKLALDDSAKLENRTQRGRADGEAQSVNTLLGFEANFPRWLPDAVNPGGELFNFKTDHNTSGDGGIDRREEIELTVAAVVTQVLPNGSLAIMGRQELRVNFELRELLIQGVVRPQDIEADNTIEHSKIAEMRVAYGGRGTLSDLQQPRWGIQLWDILFPF
ncbi:MAG: flagellar basal body L-ring protein FlgH [Rhodospirillales bacterium]|nr:MAG: flagellar basal body L-ring protein FlgH [Rhodospirillales bacterium]